MRRLDPENRNRRPSLKSRTEMVAATELPPAHRHCRSHVRTVGSQHAHDESTIAGQLYGDTRFQQRDQVDLADARQLLRLVLAQDPQRHLELLLVVRR